MVRRIDQFIEKIALAQLDAYIISRFPNIKYYTGSLGGNHLITTLTEIPTLFVTVLDSYIAKDHAQNCTVEVYNQQSLLEVIVEMLRSTHSLTVGYDDMPHQFLSNLIRRLPEVTFYQTPEIIWSQRRVKDSVEQKIMKEAGHLADVAIEAIMEKIAIGISEYELGAAASHAMIRAGAESHAFDFTIASGPRSAYPHASVTERKLKKGDLIVIDIGATYNGYRSDITRTFIMGPPDAKQMTIYEAVLTSHEAAFKEMKPNTSCKEVDWIARKIIEDAGFGKEFIHSLGHGVGLEIHEPPSISMRSADILEAGNIVSDEPGIYIHGYGGVRIEDTILVTNNSPLRLTNFPRNIEGITI